jgi:hypothetical protein
MPHGLNRYFYSYLAGTPFKRDPIRPRNRVTPHNELLAIDVRNVRSRVMNPESRETLTSRTPSQRPRLAF